MNEPDFITIELRSTEWIAATFIGPWSKIVEDIRKRARICGVTVQTWYDQMTREEVLILSGPRRQMQQLALPPLPERTEIQP